MRTGTRGHGDEVDEAIARRLQPLDVAHHGVERQMRHDAEKKRTPEAMPREHGGQHEPEERHMRPVGVVMHAARVDGAKPDHVQVGKERAGDADDRDRTLAANEA